MLETNGLQDFFNSHPHKEDDADELGMSEVTVFSTHILTRRMTTRSLVSFRSNSAFQLTSSQGG